MFAATINLTIFTMMIIIYLNEMRNISMFIYKFKYIKDYSKIIMEEKCNNIYCEAETDRYQIAKNSYKLLLPNDIFNSKTYIIMTFIVSIMIYIYYYYLLFDSTENNKFYYFLHFVLLLILVGMIIVRYTPYDEQGYLNYFKDFNKNWAATLNTFVTSSIAIIIPFTIYQLKKTQVDINPNLFIPTIIKFICFILSILLIFNIMNIVMSFRSNTKPILITKELSVSLQKSFNILDRQFNEEQKVKLNLNIGNEYTIFNNLKENIMNLYCKKDPSIPYSKTKDPIISYILNILRAFNELSKITLNNLIDTNNEANTIYIRNLKKIIKDNYDLLIANYKIDINSDISDVSFIFNKTVKIPFTYKENNYNNNENNKEYTYTADISYDNPNLFYEKYWDINLDNVLTNFEYFVPTIFGIRPNIFKIAIIITIILIIILFIQAIYYILHRFSSSYITNAVNEFNIFTILQPLIMFLILIAYIGIFISFNTWFNKYVVYLCLDSSYKRSLNKLNNIVSPYIQMYDNKIVNSNKSYIHHYIITNVFYSILTGNIKLNNNPEPVSAATPGVTPVTPISTSIPINKIDDDLKYFNIESKLKFANINNSSLTNKNEFLNYYQGRFEGIYKATYVQTEAQSLYDIFKHIFVDSEQETIDAYFKKIISINSNTGTLSKIYYIIKKCFELFKENKFNNKFKFFKSNNKLIPYKFILTLNTLADYETFLTDDIAGNANKASLKLELESKLKDNFGITISTAEGVDTDITSILDDDDSANILTQASDIEKKQDKNLIKIIAKYLLILGHINYNRIEFNNSAVDTKKKEIYSLKSAFLYRLFTNTLLINTYEITDTFNTDNCKSNCTKYLNYIKVTSGGSGYTSEPTITITGGGTDVTNAKAIAILTPTTISRINVTSGGSGYTSAPIITITGGGGSGASATANINNGIIQSITITNGGSGYTSVPVIRFLEGGGSGASATVTLSSFTITSISIENGGSGYTTAPEIIFTGDGSRGSGAEATVNLFNRSIQSIDITNGGKGYTTPPIITFKGGGGGSDASATAIINKEGSIISINITNGGSGYTTAPEIIISAIGKDSGAEATAIINKEDGSIQSIKINNPGYGYTTAPTIIINAIGAGSGATAKVIGKSTAVASVKVTNYGNNYTSVPIIGFTGGGGFGAVATAYLQERMINENKYKNLTYIYNYLETKYVNLSLSSDNNNYLKNVITSINNKINDNDGKIFNNNVNSTLYMFRDKINNIKYPKEYDNEEDILNIANNISTTSFSATYISNIIIILICYYIISRTIK